MGMGGGKSQKGGAVNKASLIYGNPKVVAAAKERKFGGKIVGGMKPVKKARGGACGPSPFSAAHKAMKGDA